MTPDATSDGGTRNTSRTRRAILDATTRILADEGAGASLASIAAEAGVSKGGLLHHFHSREELFEAVAADSLERFREKVRDNVDLSENQPGKLVRAYVRTALADVEGPDSEFTDYWTIWEALHGMPQVAELARLDAARWDHDLAEDGLHPDRIALARFTVDGLATLLVQSSDAALGHLTRVRALLLRLVDPDVPFTLA